MRSRPESRTAHADEGFRISARVYYEDTDAAGVVYYANYLRFCERARTEWLRELGFEQHGMLKELRTAFVVRSVQADYLAPARLDDALSIVTRVANIGRASLVFAQSVLRGEELLFDSRITIACVDLTKGRPTPIPAALRSLLPATVEPS
jgi:acyl-CoA thioester hydrolase